MRCYSIYAHPTSCSIDLPFPLLIKLVQWSPIFFFLLPFTLASFPWFLILPTNFFPLAFSLSRVQKNPLVRPAGPKRLLTCGPCFCPAAAARHLNPRAFILLHAVVVSSCWCCLVLSIWNQCACYSESLAWTFLSPPLALAGPP